MKNRTFTNTILNVAGLLMASTFAPTTFAQSAAQEQAPVASQPAPTVHKHGEGRFAGLNLSDDQKVQIKKIHEDAKSKADAVLADTSLSDADKQAKVKGIHRAAMMQARGVLTPEQRQELKAKKRERRAERPQPPSM
jgi:periplasmic protein CpxP/Spy